MLHTVSQSITPEVFCAMRDKAGFQPYPAEDAAVALRNSLYTVEIRDGDKTVGIARVVGDNRLAFFIKDVVVDPRYQKRGIGQMLMEITKARGRKASLIALAEKALTTSTDLPSQTMFICHGDCYDDAKFVADYIRERSAIQDIILNYVGPVIGAHSGPGTLALFFLGTHR